MMTNLYRSPRFLLILNAHSNLLRAALVNRDLRIVASAQQKFEIQDSTFDPAEVWYKMKKVIAACFDIGRTLSREIAGVVIVTQASETVVWRHEGNEIVARGSLGGQAAQTVVAEQETSGNLRTWLLWNLTGVYATDGMTDFGKTRARSPFDAELPVIGLFEEAALYARAGNGGIAESNRPLVAAAKLAWETLGEQSS